MSYLLDTHVWLWARSALGRLGPQTRNVLESSGTAVYLSSVTTWEVVIKWRLGKLKLPGRPADMFQRSMTENQLRALSITHEHTLLVGDLPDHHQDPFDRLLVAQAVAENLRLITADPALRAYPARIHWALD